MVSALNFLESQNVVLHAKEHNPMIDKLLQVQDNYHSLRLRLPGSLPWAKI